MPENQSESIAEPVEPTTEKPVEDKPKRKGPRPAAEVRAEVEAEKNAEIEALRAQLAAAEERAKQAEAAASVDPNPTLDDIYPDSVKGAPIIKGATYGYEGATDVKEGIVVHFVEDGLTLDGQVRYRGEEYTLKPDNPDFETIKSIITMDEYAQESKWSKRFFREGPWRGKKFTEISEVDMEGLSEEAKADLIAAQQKARQKA